MTGVGAKPWKRAERIAEQCRSGKTLCRYNRQTETGSTEIVYFLEPGGAPSRSKVGAERDPAWPPDPFGRRAVRCGIQPDMDRAMTTRDARPGQASHRAPDAPGAGRMSNQRQAADRDTLAVVFWSLVIATLFLFPPVMAMAIRQFE